METIKNTPEKLILRMDANTSLANALRRSVAEIGVLAIDEMEIFRNDSALYDEVLAHRIGLIPLKTEKGMSVKTKIDFKLSKKGPCVVYSGDLQGAGKIVYNNIPITILNENHKLELVASAILGQGIEHAKYLPGIVYYRHLLEVKSSPHVDKNIQNSKSLIKPEKKGGKWICDLNDNEVNEIEEGKGEISDGSEILFIVESYGNITAKEILLQAAKALEGNLDGFVKRVK